jgi:hypothetical protein
VNADSIRERIGYDLLSTDEKKKREEEERMRRAMGAVEFYAPERKVSEFYGRLEEDD